MPYIRLHAASDVRMRPQMGSDRRPDMRLSSRAGQLHYPDVAHMAITPIVAVNAIQAGAR